MKDFGKNLKEKLIHIVFVILAFFIEIYTKIFKKDKNEEVDFDYENE